MKWDVELNFLLEEGQQGPPGFSITGLLGQIAHSHE